MTEETVYRCDVTDDRFDDRSDLLEFDIVRRRPNGWDTWSRTYHVHGALIESRVKPTNIERVFVERRDEEQYVVMYEYSSHTTGTQARERDDFMTSAGDQQLFELIENELL